MQRDRLWTAILVIGGLLALAAAVLGIVIGLGDDWDSNGERAVWFVLTVGGAVLLAAGLWYDGRSPGIATALIVIGALMCGLVVFWSIVMPIAAIAVAVLAVMWMRRPATAA